MYLPMFLSSFNNQSRSVIKKCGFKFYGDGEYEAKLLNKTFLEKQYVITNEDYKTLSIK